MMGHSSITLSHLRYVVAAAEHRSMTEAAIHLHVAQSAVSSAVAAMERQLGTQIFRRHRGRGLEVTPEGATVVDRARVVLDSYDCFLHDMTTARGRIEGLVRLGCMPTVVPFLIPRVLTELRQRHPDLIVELVELGPGVAVRDVRDGKVDLAVVYDFGLPADLHSHRLARMPAWVVVSGTDPLAQRPSVDLRALSDTPMVLLDLPHSADYFLSVLRDFQVVPQIAYRSSSYEVVRSLVARGHGFSVLNQVPRTSTTYDGGTVAHLPIAGKARPLDLCVVHRRDVALAPRVEAVRECIAWSVDRSSTAAHY